MLASLAFGVLRGMRVATAEGGGIIIAVPQHPGLWSHADVVAHHQRRYRRGELEAKLRASGFEVMFSSRCWVERTICVASTGLPFS